MTEHDELLKAVLAAPADDAPRLAYADALEERGEADRAEFIRTQIELARLPRGAARRDELTRRETELLRRHAYSWAEPLGARIKEWVFRRGFIEKVGADLVHSPDGIRELLRMAPIRHVRSTGQFCELGGLVEALPELTRLTGLELWGLYAVDDESVRAMLTSPHLLNLRTLILYHDRNGNLIDDEVIAEGLASPYRANLRYLAVNIDDMWRGPSDRVIRAMAESPHLRRVRKLTLSDTRLDAGQLAGLFRSMPRLERIDLHGCQAPAAFWDALLARAAAGKLRWLRLSDARVVEPGEDYGAELSAVPRYRVEFRRARVRVDWSSTFVDPWNGGCWKGHSWDTFQRDHLFGMWPYVEHGDFDGLEGAFREDCCKYAGDEAVAAVDSLRFDKYGQRLEEGLKQAIAAASRRRSATSIYLRIRPDLSWDGCYHVSDEPVATPFTPRESFSYSGVPLEFEAPSFPEAAEARDLHPRRGTLDPGGAWHYLLARTVAAFGRCAAGHASPVPVFIDCMYVLLRISGS